MWLTALLTLTLFPANAQADSHRVPLQVRFNQPSSFEGALPWYHGKPQGFKGKLPISYIPAAQIDPEWENNSLPIGNSNIGASKRSASHSMKSRSGWAAPIRAKAPTITGR